MIPEAAWMIERRLRPAAAEARFLTLVTSDRFDLVDLVSDDYQNIRPFGKGGLTIDKDN